jgi:hypothetical protein
MLAQGASEQAYQAMLEASKQAIQAATLGGIDLAGHSGYENSEGGAGTVTLFVEAGQVHLHHEDYILTRETSEATL